MKNPRWLSLAILLFFLVIIIQVGAQQTVVSVDPEFSTREVGREFTVRISIDHVTNLYGFELKLGYDTTILDIVGVDVQPFLNEPSYTIKDEINDTLGTYRLAITSWNPAEPKSGSGTLAKITFKVAGSGNSTLNLYDDIFVNSEGNVIPHDTVDGEFSTFGRPVEPFPTVIVIVIVIVIAIFSVAALYYVRKRSR